MSDTNPAYRLEIRKKDFVEAIRTLKPRRVNAGAKLAEFQLGYIGGEAVFCVNGAQTRLAATGIWPGIARLRFAFMLAQYRLPPSGPLIEIWRQGNSIHIGSSRIAARWIDSSEWISDMALEAHLHGPDEDAEPPRLYCPHCGKREGVLLFDLPRQAGRYPTPPELIHVGGRVLGARPTRECRVCRHQWIEMTD